jgi:hypothetical protein
MRRPRFRILVTAFCFWFSVRPFYLLTVGPGLGGLAWGTVVIFYGFGYFCLGLRRLLGRILRLRDIRVLSDLYLKNIDWKSGAQ